MKKVFSFDEAIKLLKEGKCVRYRAWGNPDCHIRLDDDGVLKFGGGAKELHVFSFHIKEIIGDWEEYIPFVTISEAFDRLSKAFNDLGNSIRSCSLYKDLACSG